MSKPKAKPTKKARPEPSLTKQLAACWDAPSHFFGLIAQSAIRGDDAKVARALVALQKRYGKDVMARVMNLTREFRFFRRAAQPLMLAAAHLAPTADSFLSVLKHFRSQMAEDGFRAPVVLRTQGRADGNPISLGSYTRAGWPMSNSIIAGFWPCDKVENGRRVACEICALMRVRRSRACGQGASRRASDGPQRAARQCRASACRHARRQRHYAHLCAEWAGLKPTKENRHPRCQECLPTKCSQSDRHEQEADTVDSPSGLSGHASAGSTTNGRERHHRNTSSASRQHRWSGETN